MPVDKRESIHHQLDTCDDAALAELLTLTVEVDGNGTALSATSITWVRDIEFMDQPSYMHLVHARGG